MADSDPAARVLVADGHRTFVDLVAFALEGEPDLACVGAAYDVASARAMAATLAPDVLLVDVDLGDADGIDLAAELVAATAGLRVVVLTAQPDLDVMRRSALAGACALLPRDASLSQLLSILRTARPGGLVVHAAFLELLAAPHPPGGTRPRQARPVLTPRERCVLELLSSGHSARTIARELQISVNTSRGYVRTLMAKLGAHTQLEAVVAARAHGLLGAPGPS